MANIFASLSFCRLDALILLLHFKDGQNRMLTKTNFLYTEEFQYKHNNPYSFKLQDFDNFVLQDHQAETMRGNWGKNIFGNSFPIHLEIGVGYGHFMREFCPENLEINYVGIDCKFKRCFETAKRLSKISVTNFKFLRGRAERVGQIFAPSEVSEIYIFFPDPWPKERHHKRRLLQKDFFAQAYKILRPGGKIYIKTDHRDYFNWILRESLAEDLFDLSFQAGDLYSLDQERDLLLEKEQSILFNYQTKFERIFLGKNMPVRACILTSKKKD